MVAHHNALREVFEYGVANLGRDMPNAAAAFGVFVGGVVATSVVYSIMSYTCLGHRWRPEWIQIGGAYFERAYPKAWRSLRYLVVMLIIGLMLCTSVWFGSAMAGYNPWTTAAAAISISIVGTYCFSQVLSMASASVAVHSENSIQVGEYWEFEDGPEWGGVIGAINMFNVELMRFNNVDKSTERIVVPIDHFWTRKRKHRPFVEKTTPPGSIWSEYKPTDPIKMHIL